MLTFCVGDVHGCIAKLTRLLANCRRFADGDPARFIFLGDYIDRGPDSRSVVELIMAMQATDPDRVIALAGNHEDFLHRFDNETDVALWLANGGAATLASYNAISVSELPNIHLAWLRNLPTHYDDGQHFFVHAGIRPGIPLDQQTRQDTLWIREPFLSSKADHGRLILHGHSPVPRPEVRPNRINIDTGAVFGGALTACVFENGRREPIKFIQSGAK
jgi:serine/threonine protein phosphatase 1